MEEAWLPLLKLIARPARDAYDAATSSQMFTNTAALAKRDADLTEAFRALGFSAADCTEALLEGLEQRYVQPATATAHVGFGWLRQLAVIAVELKLFHKVGDVAAAAVVAGRRRHRWANGICSRGSGAAQRRAAFTKYGWIYI